MNRLTKIGPAPGGVGVVEYRDTRRRGLYSGPSRIAHEWNVGNEAERRAALLGARSYLGPLSRVALEVPQTGHLLLKTADREWLLLTDNVAAYVRARNEIHKHLHRRTCQPQANSSRVRN
jgi:hypothetical protein